MIIGTFGLTVIIYRLWLNCQIGALHFSEFVEDIVNPGVTHPTHWLIVAALFMVSQHFIAHMLVPSLLSASLSMAVYVFLTS